MVQLPDAAAEHYRTQQRLALIAGTAVDRLWTRMGEDLDASYARIEGDLVDVVTAAQTGAARTGAQYVSQVLYETEQVDLPAGDVIPAAFAGTGNDGRPLDSLLVTSVTTTKEAIGQGLDFPTALTRGGSWLLMTVLTAIADANREAVQASIGQRPAVGGFVRQVNLPACSACIILAGKWFRWNEGFQRHPRCDCRHVPASESLAGDMRTDPYAAFRSMTPEQQEKAFGRIEARAIRDGADISRVVNIQNRGLATASRQARRFGTPSRMTVDDIYRQAGTRTRAIRMMTEEGYITGPQVAGGNILGQREGFGQLGRGGTRRGASNAVLEARRQGARDRLNRATMTAAERRLNDAHTMMQTVEQGRNPWLRGRPLTVEDRQLAERIYQKQLAELPNQPPQVVELARLLDIII